MIFRSGSETRVGCDQDVRGLSPIAKSRTVECRPWRWRKRLTHNVCLILEERSTEGRSVARSLVPAGSLTIQSWLCASCVPDIRFRHSQGGTRVRLDRE
jgi:hypothetical protein